MPKLVLLRHGESEWNKENRFTGWTDVELSDLGTTEARKAGQILKAEGYLFDIAYTSLLKRAIKTLWIVLEELEQTWIPEFKSWRLNERHYGALQGLDKGETAARFGEEQIHIWRRSFDIRPPELSRDDPRYPGNEPKYGSIPSEQLPLAESLKDTIDRFLPYWQDVIEPSIRGGNRVLISAHGNSLRALVKYLDHAPDEEITRLNIPTGVPLVYELDEKLSPIRHYYLGDPEEIRRATETVANQGNIKK